MLYLNKQQVGQTQITREMKGLNENTKKKQQIEKEEKNY